MQMRSKNTKKWGHKTSSFFPPSLPPSLLHTKHDLPPGPREVLLCQHIHHQRCRHLEKEGGREGRRGVRNKKCGMRAST